MDTDKPKLPSIQLMLQGMSAEDKPEPRPNSGHKRHASDLVTHSIPYSTAAPMALLPHPEVGGLPAHMQKLSISSRAAPIEPNLQERYHFQSPTSMLLQQHRSPRNMHSRSFSDFSHPYYSTAPAMMRSTEGDARPPYLHSAGYHRRAISTNTLDLILQPTLQRPHDHHHHHHYHHLPTLHPSSSTTSTTTTTTTNTTTPTPTPQSPVLSDDSESHSDSSEKAAKKEGSNKYHCPYCDKGFSRPSSLRIHTYSHTGEKPFVCPEPGCSRKFSVQSNMRRHLRVHRLGRTTKRSTSTVAVDNDRRSKPLAVKPASWVKPQEQHHLSAFTLPTLNDD